MRLEVVPGAVAELSSSRYMRDGETVLRTIYAGTHLLVIGVGSERMNMGDTELINAFVLSDRHGVGHVYIMKREVIRHVWYADLLSRPEVTRREDR